ncbi:type VI secretion system tube protein Hcp, partial [Novosphingobium sp. KCTC 2891]|uniref:type VI secretion system tube protein Hcp n=1 Tax=Novosphingobium sp. KCTC 2891 TaxID=2989730 RepID=UPI00222150B0
MASVSQLILCDVSYELTPGNHCVLTVLYCAGDFDMALTYYVKIDGIVGDSTSKGHEGWLELPSFSFGEANSSSLAGGELSAGVATFADVSLLVSDYTALTSLLASNAGGKHIAAVEIEGVTDGANPGTVFDLTLNDVIVSSVSGGDSPGGDAAVSVLLGYSRIGLVTTSQNADGSLGAQQSFGWDIAANKAIDPATLTAPTNTFAGEVPDPVTYYIKIDGIAGDSVSKDHKGWFEISSYSFGESLAALVSSGGLETGKANFQDISVSLGDATPLAALLAAGASGQHI